MLWSDSPQYGIQNLLVIVFTESNHLWDEWTERNGMRVSVREEVSYK